MPDPHHNCFYYYRGPSAVRDESARHRQVEDNTTKALINVLEYSERALTNSFVGTFAGIAVEAGEDCDYHLQGAPNPSSVTEKRLVAISRLTDLSYTGDEPPPAAAGNRPDAAIHVPSLALVVFEVKLDLSLDPDQLQRHARDCGIQWPSELCTVSWHQVYDWAAAQEQQAEQGSVTAFLLEQFVSYLELTGLSPFAGLRDSDFEFFVSPTPNTQQEVKARLEALWQTVAEALPDDQRETLGEFHVGALGLNDLNAWAQTNWREQKINLTVEITDKELWFVIAGWQEKRAQTLLRWLKNSSSAQYLSPLNDYELVCYRRRCGNWQRKGSGARAWWQRETFAEWQRFPAPAVPSILDELITWVDSLENPWEKPGFHLRKTWSKQAAVHAGHDLAAQLATEVSRVIPVMDAMNR